MNESQIMVVKIVNVSRLRRLSRLRIGRRPRIIRNILEKAMGRRKGHARRGGKVRRGARRVQGHIVQGRKRLLIKAGGTGQGRGWRHVTKVRGRKNIGRRFQARGCTGQERCPNVGGHGQWLAIVGKCQSGRSAHGLSFVGHWWLIARGRRRGRRRSRSDGRCGRRRRRPEIAVVTGRRSRLVVTRGQMGFTDGYVRAVGASGWPIFNVTSCFTAVVGGFGRSTILVGRTWHDLRSHQIDINGTTIATSNRGVQKDLVTTLSRAHALIGIGHFEVRSHGRLDTNNGIVFIVLQSSDIRVLDIQ
mmetsp:Transcript_22869/g.47703  ORF Transcript_22869/g.47703 Transcript_22869/m.47703 type:complete len:303 (+) Transcript_22869:1437-2345(+)